jgi:putative phosphoribosyl transferase
MFRSPRIIFDNRVHAGRLLGEKLKELGYMSTPEAPVVALALPRGGLPVAEQVCNILGCPLDIVVRYI